MLGRIRSEFQFLEGKGQNSNVWKDKVRIPMSTHIKPEFQCLERSKNEFQCVDGYDKNYNLWKGKVRIPIFAQVG